MLNIPSFESFSSHETPFYYYDMDLFHRTLAEMKALSQESGITFHYAVKANAEKKLIRELSAAGFGADCVSGNEVSHAAANGFPPAKIMFAGVGKTDKEIRTALRTGIGCLNVESIPELLVINSIAAEMGVKAPVALRVNPNIDAHTHKYVTTGLEENKFGISDYEFDDAVAALANCGSVLFRGIQFHIGSQITDVQNVFSLECKCARDIVAAFEAKGLKVETVDFGGGLGVSYEEPDQHPIADFRTLVDIIRTHFPSDCGYDLHIEPGRSVVAQCGSLISRALYVKHGRKKDFLILDAGMNDLIRPALYGSYHKVENLTAAYRRSDLSENHLYDVVGPVCESSDVWGTDRALPESERGDIMAIRTAGAYGQVMASRYNLRDLAPAVYSDELK